MTQRKVAPIAQSNQILEIKLQCWVFGKRLDMVNLQLFWRLASCTNSII